MKYSKFLAGAIAAVAMLAVSCEREAGPTGEDPSRPVPTEIIYDVENATNDNLAIRWNAAPCIAAGAQSFTIQTCSDVEKGTSSYSTSASKVVMASDIKDGIGRYQFTEKSRYGSSYVRIRANYKKSAFSSWAWATTHDTPCLVETGFGMTDYTIAHPAISFKAAGTDDMTVLYDATNCSGADTVRLTLVDYNSRKILEDIPSTSAAAGEQKFEGLKDGKLYQVRMRQEYKGTAYPYVSDWEFAKGTALTEEGEEVESSVYQFGKGWIVVNGVAPTPRLKATYSGMVVVEWSENGFTDKAADASLKVDVSIYKDANCETLQNRCHFTTDIFNGQQPCMTFANLEPDTSYWITCQDVDSQLTSDPLEVHTSPFTIAMVTDTKVALGEYAVAENFGQLFFGANGYENTPGPKNPGSQDTVFPAAEIDTYTDSNHGFFNTLGKQGAVQTSRFNNWAVIHEKDASGAEISQGDLCIRTGCFQMGAASGVPIVFTPELTNLESMATVQLSIVVSTMAEKGAAKEYTKDDFQKLGIYTANGGTRTNSKSGAYGTLNNATVLQVAELDRPKGVDDNEKAYYGWETKSVVLRNVAPGTRIGVGAIRSSAKPTGNQRFLLRELTVKVLSYGAPTLTPPVLVSSEVNDVDFTVTFDKQEFAQTYSIAYQKCGDSTWNETTGLTEPTLTVTGLTEETEYHVRCRAVAGDFYEETILVIKTKEPEIITMGTPVVSVEPAVATAEITWAAVEKATNYEVYIKKAADADWTKAGETAETSFTVTGLLSNTDYVAGVKATYKTNASEIGEKAFKTLDYTAPSEIGTAEDFIQWLALGAPMAEAGTTLTLTADIDLTGKTLPAVESYAGTLNGNGKTIKGLSLNAPIFTSLSGTVKDLTLEGALSYTCTDSPSTGLILAALAGVSTGSVTGCTNKATVTVVASGILTSPVIAGIVAFQNGGTFSNNTNKGAVSVKHAGSAQAAATPAGLNRKPFCVIAGTLGLIVNGTVESCSNEGAVSVVCTNVSKIGARHYIGGIVGTPENARILNCINKGNVLGDFTDPTGNAQKQVWVGGIAGGRNGDVKTVDGAYIEGCDNYGACTLIAENATVNNYLAGIAGQATVEATGTNYTADASTIQKFVNCHNYGKLTKGGKGGCRLGGIAGGTATLEGCINEGDIVVENIATIGAVGGLVGYPTQTYHPVTNCKNTGNLTGTCDVAFAMGGLFGQGGNTNQSYEGCSVNCTITAQSSTLTGIILGTAKTLASGKTINYGTAEGPFKVKGTVNGTELTVDNFTSFLASDGAAADGSITTAASGKINVANVQFGE